MLRGIKLSANKLHSIRAVPYTSLRRNPVYKPISSEEITGAASLAEMKQTEKQIFGRLLF